MTTPKTSVEKLESRNEKVSDEQSALDASRWKWREIRMKVTELFNLIDHSCGFCKLAMKRREHRSDIRAKCDHCPTQVAAFCQDLQRETEDIAALLDEQLLNTVEFLEGLKARELAEDMGAEDI